MHKPLLAAVALTLLGATPGERAATVVHQDAAPTRNAPNGKATITELARGENAFVGRLEMAPGAQVPEHRDPTEEYVHVLEGHGTISIDGVKHELKPGSTVFMPANALVTYQNGDRRLVALQVFAGPGPAAKYEKWSEGSSK